MLQLSTQVRFPDQAFPKMDPAVKALWVSALRSGVYVQGYGKLRTPVGRHCCLGVLCDITHSWQKQVASGLESVLTHEIRDSVGLDSDKFDQMILVEMNDGEEGRGNKSFSQIADWIEVNL